MIIPEFSFFPFHCFQSLFYLFSMSNWVFFPHIFQKTGFLAFIQIILQCVARSRGALCALCFFVFSGHHCVIRWFSASISHVFNRIFHAESWLYADLFSIAVSRTRLEHFFQAHFKFPVSASCIHLKLLIFFWSCLELTNWNSHRSKNTMHRVPIAELQYAGDSRVNYPRELQWYMIQRDIIENPSD